MPTKEEEIQETLDKATQAYTNQKWEECHQIVAKCLKNRDTELLSRITSKQPELLWELPNAKNHGTTKGLAEQTGQWRQGIVRYDVSPIRNQHMRRDNIPCINPERTAQNIIKHGNAKDILRILEHTKDTPAETTKLAQILLDKHRADALAKIAQDNHQPATFCIAKAMLQGSLKRIPKWAKWMAAYPETAGDYTQNANTTYIENLYKIACANTNRNGLTSVLILWNNLGNPLDPTPGYKELPKLLNWDPATPCPIDPKTIALLREWSSKKALMEWGIPEQNLDNAVNDKVNSIWTRGEITIATKTYISTEKEMLAKDNTIKIVKLNENRILIAFNGPIWDNHQLLTFLTKTCKTEILTFNTDKTLNDHSIGELVKDYIRGELNQYKEESLEEARKILSGLEKTEAEIVVKDSQLAIKSKEYQLLDHLSHKDEPEEEDTIILGIIKAASNANYLPEPETLAHLL